MENAEAFQTPTCQSLESVKDIQALYQKLNRANGELAKDVILLIEEKMVTFSGEEKKTVGVVEDMLFRAYFRAMDMIGDRPNCDLPHMFGSLQMEYRAPFMFGLLYAEYHKRLEFQALNAMCQCLLDQATNSTAHFLLLTLQSVNMFYLKYPAARLHITLTQFYTYLQSQSTAIRDDCVAFFKSWLAREEKTELIFTTIVNYWPWTNKFKYILLSAILSERRLPTLLVNDCDVENFLSGTRHSLSYKSLFSAGQLVVKSLCQQNLPLFNSLLCRILMTGSHAELINLHSQWMHYVQNREELCTQIKFDQSLEDILRLDFIANDSFRFVLICTIFEKQLQQGAHFADIINYIQEHCFDFSLETQLYAYKLLANNMPTEVDCLTERLEFLIKFIKTHLTVPCSEFRNTILGKIPLVVDFLAKKVKICNPSVIVAFFASLKQIFQHGISQREYQPLYFSLRLFELLMRCFESSTHKSLMKNSHVSLHRTLGKTLLDHRVWIFQDEYPTMIELLQSCGDFDDVREIIVKILRQLAANNPEREIGLWKQFVDDVSIEQCSLSQYFAAVYLNRECLDTSQIQSFFDYSVEKILAKSNKLKVDVLKACREEGHIFGYYMALRALFNSEHCNKRLEAPYKEKAVQLAEEAVAYVLSQLNLAGGDEANASFQIIEESLEMLVSDSMWSSQMHSIDRKFLLLSFWMTLKACCELATSIGLTLMGTTEADEASRNLLRKCLSIQSKISHGCRHKGAIEAAGLTLGQLVKGISNANQPGSQTYNILYDCFDILFGSVNNISTTRRGAGLSIMFHHFIKSDSQRNRPLFQHAIKILLEHANKSRSPSHHVKDSDVCYDNFDALVLHYLCVLVRDSELKDSLSEYYDDIMMSAIARINDKEWTVRNGALQLFGALVPKIIGQKQAVAGMSEDISWQSSEITFTEYCIKLPKTNAHILEYCKVQKMGRKSTSSIILFLEFLSSIDYIRKETADNHSQLLYEYRELFWSFLSHSNEKIRKLSSKCLVRLHDFREELPDLVLRSVGIVFETANENFKHGLILFCIHAMHKLKVESQFISNYKFNNFIDDFRVTLATSFKMNDFSFYVKRYLLELLAFAQFSFNDKIMKGILIAEETNSTIQSNSKCTKVKFGLDSFLNKITEMKIVTEGDLNYL